MRMSFLPHGSTNRSISSSPTASSHHLGLLPFSPTAEPSHLAKVHSPYGTVSGKRHRVCHLSVENPLARRVDLLSTISGVALAPPRSIPHAPHRIGLTLLVRGGCSSRTYSAHEMSFFGLHGASSPSRWTLAFRLRTQRLSAWDAR
jgi:hypothetical protein